MTALPHWEWEKLALEGVPSFDLREEDTATSRHAQGVARLALMLAEALELDPYQTLMLGWGARVHDVGKCRVPNAILNKPSTLTSEERKLIERHPEWGAEMLRDAPTIIRDIAWAHHERWDGAGYPRRLSGPSIPLLARIVALCDVYEALTSDRPYRSAWTREAAVRHLEDMAGSHFDPALVSVFVNDVLPRV